LKIWNKACGSVNVKDATPRDIRHKAITDMKRAGFNDAIVGNVAGHSDPRTTKRYTHFSVEETKMPLEALVGRGLVNNSQV
jgi:integrase